MAKCQRFYAINKFYQRFETNQLIDFFSKDFNCSSLGSEINCGTGASFSGDKDVIFPCHYFHPGDKKIFAEL